MRNRPLLPQLSNGTLTASRDCSVMAFLMAIRNVSDGKVGPKRRKTVPYWVRTARSWAKCPSKGLMFHDETYAMYTHRELRQEFHDAGLRTPIIEYHAGIGWNTLGERIQDGWLAHIAIDYGVLRLGDAPMGSETFNGGHSVIANNGRKQRATGHLVATLGDPLFDGRREGIPKGYQTVRFSDYRDAAGRWGSHPVGAGHAYVILVRKG